MDSVKAFLSDVHNKLVSDSKTSMFQDIEIHFCDERIQYNKLLLSFVEPVIVGAIAEINVEDIVIIYPDYSVKILRDLEVNKFDHEVQSLTVDVFEEDVQAKGNEFMCVQCGRDYASKKRLKKHYYYKHHNKNTQGDEEIKKKKEGSVNPNNIEGSSLSTEERDSGGICCSDCGKSFTRKSDLKRHINTIHSESQKIVNHFYCQFCPRHFGRKDNLIRHVSKNHSHELL